MSLNLNQVQSFEYIIAANSGNPDLAAKVAASKADLLITGGGILATLGASIVVYIIVRWV